MSDIAVGIITKCDRVMCQSLMMATEMVSETLNAKSIYNF
jgi:hypothetical protein